MKKKIFECKGKENRYIYSIVWGCDKCIKMVETKVTKEQGKLLLAVLRIDAWKENI